MLISVSTTLPLPFIAPDKALAWAFPFATRDKSTASSSSLYIGPRQNSSQPLQKGSFKPKIVRLSSELCLLQLLPVNNPFFRQLESYIVGLTALQGVPGDSNMWLQATETLHMAISDLDKKRKQLEPVFNPEDNSILQIRKAERGEQLIETFRDKLMELANATQVYNDSLTLAIQKQALVALSDVGELLVSSFPYQVPTEDRFSYLPRLLGRAKVTFTFRRDRRVLGNVTIVADGYAAPVTAGNFVDLSVRNFYTGLPIRFAKRRIGTASEFDVANIPVLGSFMEGFYDPLTGKPRRIPLETICVDKSSKVPILRYSQVLVPETLPSSETTNTSLVREPTISDALLSFDTPGLVAMYHPDKSENGGSSEFFALRPDSIVDSRRSLFNGEYAPFGYIIEGLSLFNKLQANDIIDATYVDEWGLLNLVKIRQSSFSEVVQGSDTSKKP
jgi:peptidylprolyl isomerase